jgi:acetylornithine/N-succinyldiaminopimelate aminotransferase
MAEAPVLDATAPPSEALALDEPALFAPLYALPRLAIVSGRGARVRDANGREYLDFVSGIAVNAFGHAPPGLVRAVTRQMRTLGQISNLFANPPALELARELTAATGYARVFFCNSGTEGIDAALKFARAHARARGRTGRDIVAFEGGFHGRTGFALSATASADYRAPFEPLIPGVRFAPFNDVAALDTVLDERVCAVIAEPVQGEGGAIPARREFLDALAARTRALGAALIFDEVQSGMGRCGRLLAAEHYGVRADLTVLSKALGGGLPVAAVLMSAEVAGSLAPGMHGCTFGGSPVAATAARWVLERVRKPALLARVRRRGRELDGAPSALVSRHAALAGTRGLGLLRAVELAPDAPFDAAALVRAARAHGLLLVRGGARAVRLLPPLTVTTAEIHEAAERLERALAALATGKELHR